MYINHTLMSTLTQMYNLKYLAIELMETPDPRIAANTMGVGPPFEYIHTASEYEKRGRRARPLLENAAELQAARSVRFMLFYAVLCCFMLFYAVFMLFYAVLCCFCAKE